MNTIKKLTLLFSLLIFSLILFDATSAQTSDIVEIIKYGTSQEVIPQSSNVVINKYSADFDFSTGAADRNPAVCICSSSYDKIYITNNAQYEAIFTVITNLPEYVNVPINSLKISAGQTAEIILLISSDCSDKEQIMDYNVLVSNNFGTQYTIERELQINRCQTIETTLYASENIILPCKPVLYTVELKNPSSFTENYIVSPKNTDFFDNAQYEATIEGGKTAYMNFTYSPSCSVYGERTVAFDVQSINNKLSTKLSHELLIERAYNFTITAPESKDVCREGTTQFPITIKNTAGFENEFFFTIVNKPDWLNSDSYYAKLQSGETKEFIITANAGKDTKSQQVLDYEIKTKLGDIVERGQIALNVRNCYILDVNIISDTNPKLCSGTYVYDVYVENKGDFRERITLTDNSDYAEVFPSTIVLNSGENQTVALSLSLPDEKRTIEFKVTAELDDGKKWEDTITVKTEKKYDCTLLKFNKDRITARYNSNSSSFTVTNEGTMPAGYTLYYEGPSFIGLQYKRIQLNPGETGIINLTLYADNSTAKRKYDFKITAASDNGAIYTNDMTLKMTRTPLLQRIYDAVTANSCTGISTLLVILLIAGIIATAILAWKRVRIPLAFKLIALGIIVITLIIVLIINGLPHSRYPPIDKEANTPTNIVWHEDRTKTIDLNGYFYDPDNDTLIYSVDEEPENITVQIKGSKAKFIPDKNWFGTARIRFIASDNFGGEITSQRINLEVVEVPEFSWRAGYLNQCGYINTLLFLLLLSLVFFLRTRKEKDALSRKVAFLGVRKQKGFLYFLDKDGDVSRVPMMRRNKKKQSFKKEKVGKTVAVRRK